jgi:hypothetical protein
MQGSQAASSSSSSGQRRERSRVSIDAPPLSAVHLTHATTLIVFTGTINKPSVCLIRLFGGVAGGFWMFGTDFLFFGMSKLLGGAQRIRGL